MWRPVPPIGWTRTLVRLEDSILIYGRADQGAALPLALSLVILSIPGSPYRFDV